jgi:hypothetical protein
VFSAFFAFSRINNFHAFNVVFGSIPTRASRKSSMFMRISEESKTDCVKIGPRVNRTTADIEFRAERQKETNGTLKTHLLAPRGVGGDSMAHMRYSGSDVSQRLSSLSA